MKSARVASVVSAVMVALVLVLAQGCDSEKKLPEIVFSADRDQILEGECTTLRWEVTGLRDGDTVLLAGEQVDPSGHKDVCPPRSWTYFLGLWANGKEFLSADVSIEVVPRERAEEPPAVAPEPEEECTDDTDCEEGQECANGACLEAVTPLLHQVHVEGTAPDGVMWIDILPSEPTGEVSCGKTRDELEGGLGAVATFPVEDNKFSGVVDIEEGLAGQGLWAVGVTWCPDPDTGTVDTAYASDEFVIDVTEVYTQEVKSEEMEILLSCGCELVTSAPGPQTPEVAITQLNDSLAGTDRSGIVDHLLHPLVLDELGRGTCLSFFAGLPPLRFEVLSYEEAEFVYGSTRLEGYKVQLVQIQDGEPFEVVFHLPWYQGGLVFLSQCGVDSAPVPRESGVLVEATDPLRDFINFQTGERLDPAPEDNYDWLDIVRVELSAQPPIAATEVYSQEWDIEMAGEVDREAFYSVMFKFSEYPLVETSPYYFDKQGHLTFWLYVNPDGTWTTGATAVLDGNWEELVGLAPTGNVDGKVVTIQPPWEHIRQQYPQYYVPGLSFPISGALCTLNLFDETGDVLWLRELPSSSPP